MPQEIKAKLAGIWICHYFVRKAAPEHDATTKQHIYHWMVSFACLIICWASLNTFVKLFVDHFSLI